MRKALRGLFLVGEGDAGVPRPGVVALNAMLALLVLSLLFSFAFSRVAFNWNWAAVWEYRGRFVAGWLMTIAISAAALLLSLLFGTLAALARRAPVLLLRYLAVTYVELIRGTPLLVQILVFFYIVFEAFGLQNRYGVGVLILSLFSGAYISEIIRSGIESVGRSQLEAGRAIGLTRTQIYRYVILPQTLRQMLPPLTGQFVSLIKDSSLLSIIAIREFTMVAQEVNSRTYSTLESYLPLAAGYLILTLPLSLLTRRLERQMRYET